MKMGVKAAMKKTLLPTSRWLRGGASAAALLAVTMLLASCGSFKIGNVSFGFGQSRTPHAIVTVANTNPVFRASPSQNWSGYTVVQSGVTSVSATWQVPQVQSPPNSDSSTWVGIGGVDDNTLIQAGTDQLLTNGQPQYYVWIEMLPKAPQIVNEIDLLPGDYVTVSITQSGPTSWTVKINDHDAKQSAQKTLSYVSCACSAEWIEEAPSVNNHQSRLADFISVTFTACSLTVDGSATTPDESNARAIRMVNAYGRTIVQPQILQDDSFSLVDTAGD
jgi:hypothetical protein